MRKLRWLSLLLFVLVLPGLAAAQERTTVTGTITEAGTGLPLRNAQVTIPALRISVPSDLNGRFAIQVPSGTHTLQINLIGYKTVNRPFTAAGTPQTLNFTLETDPLGLDELVVVGYGEERRRKVTGSVASIRPEVVKEVPVTSVNQIMQGRMPGVQITQNSGTPGSAMTVRVRGSSSISGGNEPLYVVDGVPLNQGDFSYAGASSGGQDIDAVNDISPNEIERIEILKDASAAAIYGSRASNGVVLITTKRGTSGRAEITMGAYFGTQDFWKEVEFLNAQQYIDVYNEGSTARFGPASADGYDAWYCFEGQGECETTVPVGVDTDWVNEVTAPAPISNFEASVRGGTDRVRYYVSGNMINQDGIVRVMGYERLSGRVNLDYQPFERLSLVTNVALTRSVTDRGRNDDTIYGAFANATATPPIEPIYVDPDGNPCPSLTNCAYADNLYANPVGMLNEAQWEERAIRILGNAAATYGILSGLDGRVSVGLDQYTNRSRTYDSPDFGPWQANGGMASAGNVFVNKVTLEGTLNFVRALGEANEFSGVIGTSYEDNTRERTYVQAEGFPSSEFRNVDSGARITDGNGNVTESSLSSVFGRVSHTFRDRLTTTVNVRRDGSSRFGENNRWGTFPSIAVLYRIGEEPFMQQQSILGNLAIRASYGRTGNQQDLGDFAARGLFEGGANYLGTPGIAPTQLANPDLKWETTDQLNLGADFSLLTDRLSITFDWYDKQTNDLLVSLPVPSQTGYTSIWSNVGGMKNTGVELALRADLFRGGARGFNWTSSLSLAHNKNEVTSLYNGQPILGVNAVIEDEALGVFYGHVADGIFQSQAEVAAHATQTVHANPLRATSAGDIRFRDLNDDGVINSDDRQVIGSPWPDVEGGFSNTITFRSFDLTAFVQFSYGNDVFNGNRIYQDQFGSGGDNHTTRALDRWTPTNTDARYPRAVWGDPNQNTRNSSFFVEDGSYTRLKNLVLGFTLPESIAQRGGFRSARIYVQGQNLLTSTDYTGWDPEVNVSGQVSITRGYDFYTLPQARTITFGFNVGL
jgi:TonB-dependent starch-binding outer membrane protein SusC